ncbi:MAG TPA: excinuclease ABC subunit UvrA [Candidatus Eisenbacteria bacterium]|nr:excinuclease ABC subunit UvrA [Candidatus Eisenbacteria bacterium]
MSTDWIDLNDTSRDAPSPLTDISIRGARQHNLKNISVVLPRQKMIVITGVSGSGKSSLAFDTLYAEGQRRYVESLSAYARQFLGQMDKPDVDAIEGLSPAIAIEQRSAGMNPRSTVATVTEIYDYLRLLFSRLGTPHCPECGRELSRQTVTEMVDLLSEQARGERVAILAPLIRGRKGEYQKELDQARRSGFLRARVDGRVVELAEGMRLDKQKRHTIEILVDRFTVSADNARRLADSLETALRLTGGTASAVRDSRLEAATENDAKRTTMQAEPAVDWFFSEGAACPDCGISVGEMAPRLFSFNSPFGACPACSGLGTRLEVDLDLVVPDPTKSLAEGAIDPWKKIMPSWYEGQVRAAAQHLKVSMDTPWNKLPAKAREALLYGIDGKEIAFRYRSKKGKYDYKGTFEGVIPNLERRFKSTGSDGAREKLGAYLREGPCRTCGGTRLRREALAVRIQGKNIADWSAKDVAAARVDAAGLVFPGARERIAEPILKELTSRLGFLDDVGLGYLTLDRAASTLAGGEAQRIRLATQIGSGLTGVLYILDEPSIGLHARDNRRLIETLVRLRDLGNTVIVVEHDRDTIVTADHVVDLGPGAGRHGGEVVAAGTPAEIEQTPASLTGRYLRDELAIPLPSRRRAGSGKFLEVLGAREHNLKNVDVRFPLGTFTCVTGVSGSGKSTLVNDILYAALARHANGAQTIPGAHRKITGLHHVDKVVDVDQSPIGRTPRSNPATYTGAFAVIRDLFAQLPESKMRGYGPGRFSFNVKGGRCEACEGDGLKRIEMHFLPDVYVQCDVCRGRRYNRETLEVLYKGKSIADVLEMTVEEALEFLRPIPGVRRKLETLKDVGLGYVHLGQSATTLSGGEAQRVKLATELSRAATGSTVYLLDEPTTGLHFDDVRQLLEVLDRFVDRGNTVIVIEHNLDVIKSADHLIDLGPEGGQAGGRVIASGAPEEVARVAASHTGAALAPLLRAPIRETR